MSNKNIIQILVAIIGAAGLIIAALVTGIFALLVEQTKSNTTATGVAATYVAQRTVDAPIARATYTLPPTYAPPPTYTPYPVLPTPKPNITVVTPKPITVVATPSADQQNPPPGSIIPAGQGYTKKGVVITLMKNISIGFGEIDITLTIENQTGQQIVVLWRDSFIRLRDDKGKEFNQQYAGDSFWNENKQFTIASGNTARIVSSNKKSTDTAFSSFIAKLDPNTKYILISVDQLLGMTNMNWRYDIQQ